MSTPGQITYARRLLRECGMPEEGDKKEMCLIHSDGRTDSLTALTYHEVNSLINALKTAQGIPTDTPAEKMQRKIISMAHEMRWHLPKTIKVDMKQVNDWCLNKSGFKKTLKDLNYQELPAAVTRFEMLYAGYLKAL